MRSHSQVPTVPGHPRVYPAQPVAPVLSPRPAAACCRGVLGVLRQSFAHSSRAKCFIRPSFELAHRNFSNTQRDPWQCWTVLGDGRSALLGCGG